MLLFLVNKQYFIIIIPWIFFFGWYQIFYSILLRVVMHYRLEVDNISLFTYLIWSRHSTDREVAIMVLMAYLSYMLAEVRFSLTTSEISWRALLWFLYNMKILMFDTMSCSCSIWVAFSQYFSVGLWCPIIPGTMWLRVQELLPSKSFPLNDVRLSECHGCILFD